LKVVAVSQRVDEEHERNEIRDALDHRLTAFLSKCGYAPIPVSNALGSSLFEWLEVVRPSALVFSGGNNIGQFAQRDQTENALLEYALLQQLPVLGICRGMQVIAHWAGVSLHPLPGHVGTRHQLTGIISMEVNSYHEYSITQCPNGFEILARSQDGGIEAIRHLKLPWEGWMWHPEREKTTKVQDVKRIKALFGE
jgi:gamma-glutamyl-gamma-aminobutyrate hydrolase PuuD